MLGPALYFFHHLLLTETPMLYESKELADFLSTTAEAMDDKAYDALAEMLEDKCDDFCVAFPFDESTELASIFNAGVRLGVRAEQKNTNVFFARTEAIEDGMFYYFFADTEADLMDKVRKLVAKL